MSLPRYGQYKDSGVAWLGEVPGHWEVKRLKHSLSLLTEKTDRRTNPVALENIESWSGRFIATETEFAGDGVAFMQGDVLFGKLRPYLAKVLLADSEGEAVGDFHVMRPNDAIAPRFAQYQLLNRTFIDIVDGSTFGSKMPRASWEFVSSMPLVIPPMAEQTAITAFLDHETAKIDALIEKQQRLIELLKEKRQAVISHAVTKGLNLNAPMKDSEVEWLGEVPAHWVVRRLKHSATLQSGIPKGKDLTGKMTIEAPMLRVANVQDGYLDLSEVHSIQIEPSELERYSLEYGDVLMNEGGDNDKLGRGTVWKAEITPCIHQNHVFAIRPIEIEPEWLDLVTRASYAKYHFYRVAKQSTNLASISSTNIKETPLVIPPMQERKQISLHINQQLEKFDLLEKNSNLQIELLKERRTALISAAVTGKIDVRGWAKAA
jgi:type I restriction enzyme S subunit